MAIVNRSGWVIRYRTPEGRELLGHLIPDRERALVQASIVLKRGNQIVRIDGPDDAQISGSEVAGWCTANWRRISR